MPQTALQRCERCMSSEGPLVGKLISSGQFSFIDSDVSAHCHQLSTCHVRANVSTVERWNCARLSLCCFAICSGVILVWCGGSARQTLTTPPCFKSDCFWAHCLHHRLLVPCFGDMVACTAVGISLSVTAKGTQALSAASSNGGCCASGVMPLVLLV